MKKLTIAASFALAFGASVIAAETPDYRESMTRAAAAFEAEEWPALNEALDAAQSTRPWSLYVYRNRILARLLADRQDEALALAAKAADRGLSFNLTGHPAFDAFKALPAYAPIAERMEANMAAIGDADSVREFSANEHLPEAIAYDRKNNLYIGSVRNGSIFKAKKNAQELTRVATARGGVFDLEIRGDTIWAAVNNQLAYEDANPENKFASVMAFNAKTGAPFREIRVSDSEAIIGDIEVAKDGTVYASDSVTPRILKMEPGGQTLDVFADDPRFVNLQGIALDEKNHRMFVADYLGGLFVINTQSGAVTALENTADAHLGGIDGLYYYKGGLIGIQNGTTPIRIVYIGLNDDATAVSTFIAMQQNLDEWNEPTHGAVLGKKFHYIATSNWPSYDGEWKVREGAELKPLKIMTLPLQAN
ncbi:hypothetical protein [Hyphococcus sp.]|uniref:hypothetical protein n=1 Tax=Hyphococcus sp. TaxID=2038636 RepID=UPI00208A6F8C|nr:MAG: hypothetical protein DHS20C04_25340 [Marinicaulis sp.]